MISTMKECTFMQNVEKIVLNICNFSFSPYSMDSEADLIDIVPTETTTTKSARPKSAVRRQTIDRDLDMIEGLDFTEEVDLDEEDEIDIHLQGEEEEEIDIHLKDDEEIIIDGDNHGEEEAADLEVDIVPYEFHDDAGK